MLNSLYKYLVLHHHVGIPGVGSFIIEQKPASVSEDDIHAPGYTVAFVPGTALADKQFYQFLSHETGCSEVDAVRKFQDFAYQLRKDINAHPWLTLKGFGTLKKNATGALAFEPLVSVDKYFLPVALTEVHRTGEVSHDEEMIVENAVQTGPEEVIAKDRWWIWALILAILALGVIGYFYIEGAII